MDPVILTPRLKLTLITKVERGSPELEWLHELRSDERATWWSIFGKSKSIEDTEEAVRNYIPINDGKEKTYRIAYAVHEVLEPKISSVTGQSQATHQGKQITRFIGFINVRSLDATNLKLPEEFTLPVTATTTTLTVEVAYLFLPIGWGKGYATEALLAVFETCKTARTFWTPFSKLYIRSLVNAENPASLRVMEKTGMTKLGVYEWTGKAVFLAGRWRERDRLCIFSKYLIE